LTCILHPASCSCLLLYRLNRFVVSLRVNKQAEKGLRPGNSLPPGIASQTTEHTRRDYEKKVLGNKRTECFGFVISFAVRPHGSTNAKSRSCATGDAGAE
jgi:hypothetical protein